MAKTIIIDTQVNGVDEAVQDIGKIDNAVDGVNSKKIAINLDTEKIAKQTEQLQKTGDNISKLGEGIAGAFTLANGVVGTMGASIGFTSEEIENAQQKSAAFLGIMQSLKPVTEGISVGFKILGAILKTNPLILLATIIGGIIVSFLDMGAIMDGIKKGFKAIGEVVGKVFDGLISAVDYYIELNLKLFDILTLGLTDTAGAYAGYKKQVEETNKAEAERQNALQKERDAIRKTIGELEAKAKLLDAEITLIEKQKETVTRRYDDEIAFAKASGKETYAIEQQKLEDLIEFTKKEIELKQKRYEIEQQLILETAKLTEKTVGKFFTDQAKLTSDDYKNRKKANEDRKNDVKKLSEDVLNFERDLEVNKLAKQKENYDKWKALEEEKTKKAKEEADKRAAWEKQVLDDLAIVQSKKSGEYLTGTMSTTEANKNFWGAMYKDIAAQGNAVATEDLELQKDLRDAKIQLLSDTFNVLSGLTDLFGKKNEANAKKAFEVNKALSIADAIIKTYQAANAIFASAAANPSTVLFPAQPFITAGLAIAAGLGNVAKIASTQFGSSGGASGGGAGSMGTGPSLPSVDLSSTPFQFPSSPNQTASQHSQRVYVLENDIRHTSNRVSVAEANASFG